MSDTSPYNSIIFTSSEVRDVIHLMLKKDKSFNEAVDGVLNTTSAWEKRFEKANPAVSLVGGENLQAKNCAKTFLTAEFKLYFAKAFNHRYRQSHQQNIVDVSDNEEPPQTKNAWQIAKAIALGFLSAIDFLLFSIPSVLWHFRNRNEKAPISDSSKMMNKRQLLSAGKYLRPRHDRALARALKPYMQEVLKANKKAIEEKFLKPFEEGIDGYKPRWQAFWHHSGFAISFAYGIGSAVMVFFLIYMAGWSLIPLVLLSIVFCGANWLVNTKFAMFYMPEVFQWLFAQGGFMQGLYTYTEYDKVGNVVEVHALNQYQKSIVRMGFGLSLMSALAMSSLTYAALLWAIKAIPVIAVAATPVAGIIAVITLFMMTVLFTYFWKEVAHRGGLFGYIKHKVQGMTEGLTQKEIWAARALFVVNLVVVSVGFVYLALLCIPYTISLVTPLVTYLGIGPGVMAQIPNIFSFTSSMTRKIVLKFSRDYWVRGVEYLDSTEDEKLLNWMPKWVRGIAIALGMCVIESLRIATFIVVISALFVPMVVGLLLSQHIKIKCRDYLNIDSDADELLGDNYSLSLIHILAFISGSNPSFDRYAFARCLLIVVFTIIPCIPLVLLESAFSYGPKGKNEKASEKSTKATVVMDDPQQKDSSNAVDKSVSQELPFSAEGVELPRPALHTLLFNEVLSNAFAYSVDVATHTTNIWVLLTTFVFTYFQRGDTQFEEKGNLISPVQMASKHWENAKNYVQSVVNINDNEHTGHNVDASIINI